MYPLILCIAILAAFGFVRAPRGWAKLEGIVFGGIIGAAVGLLDGLVFSALTPRHDVVYEPETMVSMRTTDGVGGTFVWGTGSIGGETFYNFMIKQKDGSITPRSVKANSLVAIIEDESLKNSGFWRTTFNESDKTSALYNWGFYGKEIVRQEFRVPVDTVIQSFKVQ